MNQNCNFSLQKVHELSKTLNIDAAAKQLNVSVHILNRFIARFTIKDNQGAFHILNYQSLKALNNLTISEYTQINGGTIRNFAEMKFKEVHRVCRLSDSIDDCACALNILPATLQKWLEYKSTQEEKSPNTCPDLNYLHNMTESAAKIIYGAEYDQVVKIPVLKLQGRTLYQLHYALKNSKTVVDVIKKFNIKEWKLRRFFMNLTDKNNNILSADNLSKMTYEEANDFFEEQYGMNEKTISLGTNADMDDLSKISLNEIHKLTSTHRIGSISEHFNIEIESLKRFLARFSYENSEKLVELLSFEKLKNMKIADATRIFGPEYKKPNGGTPAILENYTLQQLHELLITSLTIRSLSIQLDKTEQEILHAINLCPIKPASNEEKGMKLGNLKNLSIREASEIFKEYYKQTIGSWNIPTNTQGTNVSEQSIFKNDKKRKVTREKNSNNNNKKLILSGPVHSDKDNNDDKLPIQQSNSSEQKPDNQVSYSTNIPNNNIVTSVSAQSFFNNQIDNTAPRVIVSGKDNNDDKLPIQQSNSSEQKPDNEVSHPTNIPNNNIVTSLSAQSMFNNQIDCTTDPVIVSDNDNNKPDDAWADSFLNLNDM